MSRSFTTRLTALRNNHPIADTVMATTIWVSVSMTNIWAFVLAPLLLLSSLEPNSKSGVGVMGGVTLCLIVAIPSLIALKLWRDSAETAEQHTQRVEAQRVLEWEMVRRGLPTHWVPLLVRSVRKRFRRSANSC